MLTAINITLSLLLPSLVAVAALYISLQSLRRHITIRQLSIAAFVLVAGVSSVSVLFKAVYLGQAVPALPFVLIVFTLAAAVAQFAIASFFGAVNRLRQTLA